jgi:thiamine monophosphate synthase
MLASNAFANKASYVAFGAFYPTKTKKVDLFRAKLSLIRWAQRKY